MLFAGELTIAADPERLQKRAILQAMLSWPCGALDKKTPNLGSRRLCADADAGRRQRHQGRARAPRLSGRDALSDRRLDLFQCHRHPLRRKIRVDCGDRLRRTWLPYPPLWAEMIRSPVSVRAMSPITRAICGGASSSSSSIANGARSSGVSGRHGSRR